MTIASCASHNVELKCGKEYRVSTKDSMNYQGTLWMNNGTYLILDASSSVTLQLKDLSQAFHVERHTVEGVVAGCALGAAVGVYLSEEWAKAHPSEGWFDFQVVERMGITLLCTVVGSLIGTSLGNIPAYKEIKIDMLPICPPESGEMMRIGISYEF